MPPRLGELLIKMGELTAPEIEQALRAQVMWGGRLGTNLVELGYIDLDVLATALGKQKLLPAALGKHFDKADPAVQSRLGPDLAEKYSCVPLMLAGPQRSQLILATLAPLDAKAIAIIADDMRWDPEKIVVSIAGELRIRYHLERVYNIARGTRFLRSKGKTIPPFPQLEIDPLAFEDSQVDNPADPVPPIVAAAPPPTPEPELEPEDDDAFDDVRSELQARLVTKAAEKARATTPPPIAEPPAGEPLLDTHDTLQLASIFDEDVESAIPETVDETEGSNGRERRRYVETLDATPRNLDPAQDPQEVSLGRISIKRVPRAVTVEESGPTQMGLTLGEATRAIRRSQDRNRVAELVSETLFRFMLSCDAALMLVIRGDAAMSWKGFSRAGGTLPEIAMPLDQPGLIPRVIERVATVRSPSSDLSPIDQLLLVSLGAKSGDLVVVPVSIANSVMCVIALATQADSSPATAESVAAAAGAAFARLMRNASR